jgi:voltage-gated potassium channel
VTTRLPATPYDLFSLALSIVALSVLGMLASGSLSAESRALLQQADLALCGFFFADFVRNLVRADDRWRYLYTWGWLDLAASIPAVDALRLGRVGRLVRILRVFRVVKASRLLLIALQSHRRESAAWAAMLIAILVVFGGSIAILELEAPRGGNITNAEDALWWAIVTITTVGYGDFYPITTEGRLVAVCLMVVGVGLFGTLSGMAASWFTEAVAAERATQASSDHDASTSR